MFDDPFQKLEQQFQILVLKVVKSADGNDDGNCESWNADSDQCYIDTTGISLNNVNWSPSDSSND